MKIESIKNGDIHRLYIKSDDFSVKLQRVGCISKITTRGKIKSRRTLREMVKQLDKALRGE